MLYFYFAYNRPDSVKRSLPMLISTMDIKYDKLIITVDGARSNKDLDRVNEVNSLIKDIIIDSPITNYKLNIRSTNYGLQRNIIETIKYELISEKDEKIFAVIEDDILVLDNYKYLVKDFVINNDKMTIAFSGWFWPLPKNEELIPRYFNSFYISCWGWGGYSSFFLKFIEEYENNREQILKSSLKIFNKYTFGYSTTRFSYQAVQNLLSVKSTWAIYWYLFCLLNDYKCHYSTINSIVNIGLQEGENYQSGDRLIVPKSSIGISDYNFDNYLFKYFKKYDKRIRNTVINIILYLIILFKK